MPEENDPDIDRLELSEIARSAAHALRKEFPNRIVFESGRRDLARQASAMAANIAAGNRKWIEQTYARHIASTSLQQWVDSHPEAVTREKIAEGLLETLRSLGSDAGRISRHLTGDAFDVRPVADTTLARAICAFIPKLPHCDRFLTREGGLVRWHAQFSPLVPGPTPEEAEERTLWRRNVWNGASPASLTLTSARFWLQSWEATEDGPLGERAANDELVRAVADMIRALSWVASRHGRRDGFGRDPAGVGASTSPWWRALSDPAGPPTVALRGRAVRPFALDEMLPSDDPCRLSSLGAHRSRGGDAPNFHAAMSFRWAVPKLVIAANSNGDAFRFKDWRYSPLVVPHPRSQRLLDGAVKSGVGGASRSTLRRDLERALQLIALLDPRRHES